MARSQVSAKAKEQGRAKLLGGAEAKKGEVEKNGKARWGDELITIHAKEPARVHIPQWVYVSGKWEDKCHPAHHLQNALAITGFNAEWKRHDIPETPVEMRASWPRQTPPIGQGLTGRGKVVTEPQLQYRPRGYRKVNGKGSN